MISTLRNLARTLVLLIAGIFGGLKAVDAIRAKWEKDEAVKRARIALRMLMAASDGPESFASYFVPYGATLIHLSRNRILVKTGGKGSILVTEDFISINPTEDDFNRA